MEKGKEEMVLEEGRVRERERKRVRKKKRLGVER